MNGPVVRVYGYSSVLTVSIVSLTAKVEHVCAGGGMDVPDLGDKWVERPVSEHPSVATLKKL